MAIRAFLLCGDEKAVQAVTQILDELDVSFEHSSEPAFSLKRLSTQRFDLLIVDCDNAQNATQVFNCARASSQNKTSIAIAIVEGKAGVPNAFRLGASLVLTKPVALEQVRNTLRTGIGMTRKDGQDAKTSTQAAAPALPIITAPPVVPAPARTPAVLTPVAPIPHATTVVARSSETPKPAISSVSEKPPLVPRPVSASIPAMQEHKPALTDFTEPKAQPTAGLPPLAKVSAASVGLPPASKNFDSVFSSSTVTEKATTPQIKSAKATGEAKGGEGPTLSIVDPLAEDEDVLDPVKDHGVPSFGGMGKAPFAGVGKRERGGKGALIAAMVVLMLTGGGYGAWLTQPPFRNMVAWEYLNVMNKIGALRGQSQPTAATKPPDPVPAPTATQPPATPASPNTDVAASGAGQSASAEPATGSEISATNDAAAQAGDVNAQKAASAQTAKPDTSANRSATNPSLVPASASLPSPATTKAPAGDLLEVPEDFADDQIVHRVHPVYPKQARARKLRGTVVLQAIVNKQGRVDSLQLISGDALLAQAAADAVKQWRYKPYQHNGEAVDFQTRVTVDFKLP